MLWCFDAFYSQRLIVSFQNGAFTHNAPLFHWSGDRGDPTFTANGTHLTKQNNKKNIQHPFRHLMSTCCLTWIVLNDLRPSCAQLLVSCFRHLDTLEPLNPVFFLPNSADLSFRSRPSPYSYLPFQIARAEFNTIRIQGTVCSCCTYPRFSFIFLSFFHLFSFTWMTADSTEEKLQQQ